MARNIVVFILNGMRFGLDASRVVSISELFPLFKAPQMPDYIAGMGSLHGVIVPVVDLCKFLGMKHTGEYRLVILLRRGEDDAALMVDDVVDVRKREEAQPADHADGNVYIETSGDDNIAMLDVDATLDGIFGKAK